MQAQNSSLSNTEEKEKRLTNHFSKTDPQSGMAKIPPKSEEERARRQRKMIHYHR